VDVPFDNKVYEILNVQYNEHIPVINEGDKLRHSELRPLTRGLHYDDDLSWIFHMYTRDYGVSTITINCDICGEGYEYIGTCYFNCPIRNVYVKLPKLDRFIELYYINKIETESGRKGIMDL